MIFIELFFLDLIFNFALQINKSNDTSSIIYIYNIIIYGNSEIRVKVPGNEKPISLTLESGE